MIYLLAALVFAADQVIKWEVRSHMAITQSIPVFPPVLYLDYIRNSGGAFGILPHFRILFVLVAMVVIAAVIYVDVRYKPVLWTRIGLGLLLGGALGNMWDRIVFGNVTDYMYLQIIHFPIFNLADVMIDVGVIMLLIRSLQSDRSSRKDD
ncbi:signal peptidase II [Alicyclobacillus sp. SO9]|uniref:signal peptidase II n=1 Tax=Alicyclobacillus sp. SO9 TaxID=2665646 RepID=UPI0018E8AB3C|nr:signal peptidase II [Alicyclobacillus sp. SO9]QQE80722.1 signal peptidase II [Alicyclobacillus sp. SO9]